MGEITDKDRKESIRNNMNDSCKTGALELLFPRPECASWLINILSFIWCWSVGDEVGHSAKMKIF